MITKLLTFLFLTWSLIAPGFCYEIDELEFSLSNRGGSVNVGGNITLSSMFGSTNFGFGTSHGASGSSTNVYSTFTPPSMHQAAAMIGQTGVDPHQVPVQQNPLLMLHGFNARGIELLAQPRSTHALPLLIDMAVALGEAAVVGSRVEAVIKTGQLAKETLEEGKKKLQDEAEKQGAASSTGGPGGEEPGDGGKFKLPESQEGLKEFIETADRTGYALKSDPFHRSASFGSGSPFQISKIPGGDGSIYTKIAQNGSVNGKQGVFEYIVNAEGKITHQLFLPN